VLTDTSSAATAELVMAIAYTGCLWPLPDTQGNISADRG
jgi:hypothetical protein